MSGTKKEDKRCECSEKLLETLKKDKQLDSAEFKNQIGFLFSGPNSPFSIPIRTKKGKKVVIQSYFPSYCPICGKKYPLIKM